MSGRTGDIRVDAVQVIPSPDGLSVNLSTADTTTINPATREESTALHGKMASDEDMRAVTRAPLIGKRQTEMAKKNPVPSHSRLQKKSITGTTS